MKIDVEQFIISLRLNRHADGRLNPIHLADSVEAEAKIVEEAIRYSQRKWVKLTNADYLKIKQTVEIHDWPYAVAIKLKELNT